MAATTVSTRSYQTPTIFKSGWGGVATLPDEVRALGLGRPLLVTDQGLRNSPLIKRVQSILEDADIGAPLFAEVEPNPSIELIGVGSAFYRSQGCDGLIAVGGGSSMDTAKSIGVEIVEGRSIADFEVGRDPLSKRIPPFIAVPTTAGTGSEATLWAVITDNRRKIKFNVGGPELAAWVALVDPELHVGLPAWMTAGTGVDALTHAIECFTCVYHQPMTDAFALLAMEYVSGYLRRAVSSPTDQEARTRMAAAATLGGLSYGTESAGAVHAMSQTAGGFYHGIHHGQLTAALLAPVNAFNWEGEPELYARVAGAMGEETRGKSAAEGARLGVRSVAQLVTDTGIPTIGELGIKEEDIPELSELAFQDSQTPGNPREITAQDYERIYRAAHALQPGEVFSRDQY